MAFMLWAGLALAQNSPLLKITDLMAPPGQLLQVRFSDLGTGATNYLLQSSIALGQGSGWATVSGSLVLDLGQGQYQAVAPSPVDQVRFYRILAEGGLQAR